MCSNCYSDYNVDVSANYTGEYDVNGEPIVGVVVHGNCIANLILPEDFSYDINSIEAFYKERFHNFLSSQFAQYMRDYRGPFQFIPATMTEMHGGVIHG